MTTRRDMLALLPAALATRGPLSTRAQPTKFELFINGKTAKALDIKIPDSITLRADRVIE